MARYVSLLTFTEKGGRTIKKSATRAHAFKRAAARAGVKIEEQLWTLGRYDGLLVLSANNEERILHCLTELAATGNVKTETLQAFDERQFKAIVRR